MRLVCGSPGARDEAGVRMGERSILDVLGCE